VPFLSVVPSGEIYMKTYPVKAIANYFIKKAKEKGEIITPMKLIKLCYIAQGTALAYSNQAIFEEEVEAWKYGPVIPCLYKEFKKYGNSHINEYYVPVEDNTISMPDEDDKEAHIILEAAWNKFGSWSGIELSAWTHQPDSAWSQIYKKYSENSLIPSSIIKEEFLNYIQK
jgi:uncharacterized phage-associated protein